MRAITPAAEVVDLDLIRRFDGPGPRYTSYPTADRFVEAFREDAYRSGLARRNIGGVRRPLSLYVHVPFCDTLCFYCGCNKIATRDRAKAAAYLGYLEKEIEMQGAALDDKRVVQMHWGGGTPNFLSVMQMVTLMRALRAHFEFAPDGEYSIEIDPRSADRHTVQLLAELGFNRMSIGVQDFDPAVQRAVNRIQSEAQTAAVIEAAREFGFASVNLDLMYGLPKQNRITFNRTLARVIALAPDRIALYSYAHLPQLFKPQRRILEADLPSADEKLKLMALAITRLAEAGYVHIGMDHFALAGDALAVAQRQGRLHRNFQGYTTRDDCDLIGLGVSAIGAVGPIYCQNHRTLEDYCDALDRGELPIMRGLELTGDDLARRAVIQALMCQFAVSKESIEIAYLLDFDRAFAAELEALSALERLGLVVCEPRWIAVAPKGRLLVRAIAMVFDRYLRDDRERRRYSKVI
jgi:oxygen-independent coproporphyrinogen-3 oxidase